MNRGLRELYPLIAAVSAVLCAVAAPMNLASGDVPIGGYTPLVGFGLTDEYKDEDDGSFWISDPSILPVGDWLGTTSPFFDIALLDTGAAVHLITDQARQDFNIEGNGFDGTEPISLGGATGTLVGLIEDPLGVFAGGLAGRSGLAPFAMHASAMSGQTSVAIVSAPAESALPNVVGLPLISQYATHIRADLPQIFELEDRTVRSPQIDFLPLGSGGAGLIRRAPLIFRPNDAFLTLPQYLFNFNNILADPPIPLEENPASPTAMGLVGGGLFLDVDITDDGNVENGMELLVDTGASVSAVSEIVAARLGFDAVLDEPDFRVTIVGSGGTISAVPGFYADELNIDTVGGSFTLNDVPLVVLDITDPGEPGNIVDGIIGTNLFADRNIVIDPNPATGGGGASPSLYISDSVTASHAWATTAATGDWDTTSSWNAAGTPGPLWDIDVTNVRGSDQEAVVAADSQVFRVGVAGASGAKMDLRVQDGATLLVFAGVTVEEYGGLVLDAEGRMDAQFVDLAGGEVRGDGIVRAEFDNRGGTVAPGDPVGRLTVEGIFANRPGGTVAIDLGGTTPVTEYDQLAVDGDAILGGALHVSLVDLGDGTFMPEVGNTFQVLTATQSVISSFDTFILPEVATWSVSYGFNSVSLEVLTVAALSGDFDSDGDVDGDDFLAWQNGFGITTDAVLSDGDADADGDVDGDDFIIWQADFGASGGGGSWVLAVPEPAAMWLGLATFAAFIGCRRPYARMPSTTRAGSTPVKRMSSP